LKFLVTKNQSTSSCKWTPASRNQNKYLSVALTRARTGLYGQNGKKNPKDAVKYGDLYGYVQGPTYRYILTVPKPTQSCDRAAV